ncbi:MAG: M61 family metallopeptidase [Candidatus Acidiferrales bacterium]
MKRHLLVFLALASLLVSSKSVFAAEPVCYELGFRKWNTHLLDITIRANGLDGKAAQFAMPYWAPGVYIVEEFATNVQGFFATDPSGRALPWHKVDGSTWQIDLNGSSGVVAHYLFYANGMPIRGAQYDERHAAMTGAAIWMYLVNGKDRPAELAVKKSQLPANWKIATALPKTAENTFAAQNYDWFADCPIEISDYQEKSFNTLGTTYHVVVHDEADSGDYTRFTEDLGKVVEKGVVPILAPAVRASGSPLDAPFSEYWFLIHISTNGFGAGVEHLTSTMIMMGQGWDDHSATNHDFLSDVEEYKIDLATHEFFHAWNVKRLRPRELGPFDYSRQVHTSSLWISEGLTNYFTWLAILRSAYWKPQTYLDHIARVITGLESEPGRKERSIAETSYDTWFGFSGSGAGGFGPSFSNNLANTSYSYYDSGQILGVLLDLEIRHATNNRKSLDDWMQLMYRRFALPKPGFEPEDAIKAASDVTGTDMSEFFHRYVTGKEELPYRRDFGYAGIQVEKVYSNKAWIGAEVRQDRNAGGAYLANVVPGSPAENDGLDRGDVILAVDGRAVDSRGFGAELASRKPGDRMLLTLNRHGVLRQVAVTTAANPYPEYELKLMDNPDGAQKTIYDSMLGVRE